MKRGFTLIELLAVIIVLALIALIVIPGFTDIINKSKKSSNKVSAEEYVKALKNELMSNRLKDNFKPEVCEYENNITTCDDKEVNVDFKGNIESAKVTFEDSSVIYYIVYLLFHILFLYYDLTN